MLMVVERAPQSGKPDAGKGRFYKEMEREWSMANANELILGDFNGHVGNVRKDMKVNMEGME